jgi:4-amino-4-deoxy-L-arabinose transferase-like glycosyltransferase
VYRKLSLYILLLAFAVRLAAGCWWERRLPEDVKFAFPDSETYWELGRALAAGRPFEMNPDRRVFRTPGYPALLASVFWLVGDDPPVLVARALGALLGVLAVGGVMGLAGLLFGRQTALLAGAIAAIYPDAVAMSTFVLSEAPFCPLMLLHLCCWTLAWRAGGLGRQAAWWSLAGGAVAGMATLMRPSWLLFVPLALGIGLLRPANWRRLAWIGLWSFVGLLAIMAPWWFRNWQVTGAFVPTTLQVGESLYDGLNLQATGQSDMRFVDDFRAELRAEDAANPQAAGQGGCFEARLDRRMRDAAIAWAMRHPERVVQLAAVKFLRIWNVWPNEASLRSWTFRAVLTLAYVPLLIWGLGGVWRTARGGWPYLLCVLPALYFTGLHMVFVGSIRYRQPALLVLIVPAAGLVIYGWRGLRGAGVAEGDVVSSSADTTRGV